VKLTTHMQCGGTAQSYTSTGLYVFVTRRLLTLAECYP
jgi:hypothetical protein